MNFSKELMKVANSLKVAEKKIKLELDISLILKLMKNNPEIFDKINSDELQLEVVKANGTAIQYIKNPSEKVQLEAVKQDGTAIQYIENPSEKVQWEAVKQDGTAIQYIENPSEKVIEYMHDNMFE